MLKGKNLSSLIDPSKTITKRITAKNGGRITVQTASGLYFTLNIGPGSLEKDTDISLTPTDESPIENYPDPDDPGVIIGPDDTNLGDGSTVTVSEDPPTPNQTAPAPIQEQARMEARPIHRALRRIRPRLPHRERLPELPAVFPTSELWPAFWAATLQ